MIGSFALTLQAIETRPVVFMPSSHLTKTVTSLLKVSKGIRETTISVVRTRLQPLKDQFLNVTRKFAVYDFWPELKYAFHGSSTIPYMVDYTDNPKRFWPLYFRLSDLLEDYYCIGTAASSLGHRNDLYLQRL